MMRCRASNTRAIGAHRRSTAIRSIRRIHGIEGRGRDEGVAVDHLSHNVGGGG